MSDSIHTVFASVQPQHVRRKERQLHRSANLAAGIRMPSRDISAHDHPVAATFVTKVTKLIKFDALPARFVTAVRFVTT